MKFLAVLCCSVLCDDPGLIWVHVFMQLVVSDTSKFLTPASQRAWSSSVLATSQCISGLES